MMTLSAAAILNQSRNQGQAEWWRGQVWLAGGWRADWLRDGQGGAPATLNLGILILPSCNVMDRNRRGEEEDEIE